MSTYDRKQRADLRRELDEDILPRQLLALERVAERLDGARPAPDPAFRAQLGQELGAMPAAARAGTSRVAVTSWVAPALGAVALGLALLAVAAALAL